MNENKKKDIRTLCYHCVRDMRDAGILLRRAGGTPSKCDKCNRPGSDWEVV